MWHSKGEIFRGEILSETCIEFAESVDWADKSKCSTNELFLHISVIVLIPYLTSVASSVALISSQFLYEDE